MSRARDIANYGDGIDTSSITSGTFADARIAQSNVTQHESAINATLPAGTVVQVKSTIYSAPSKQTSSTSYVATGLTVSITPNYSNSLMVIFWESGTSHWNAQNGNSKGVFSVYNGSSLITGSEKVLFWNTTGTTNHYGYVNVSSHTSETLSGASTSTAITYQLYAKASAGTFYYFNTAPATYRPTMTVFEVKQ